MADLVTIIGISASIFTAIDTAPQLVRIFRERKPSGLSPLTLGALCIGVGLWVVYGFLKNDSIIIVSNGLSLAINLLISYLSIKYKRRGSNG